MDDQRTSVATPPDRPETRHSNQDSPEHRSPARRGAWGWIVGGVILIGGGSAGYFLWSKDHQKPLSHGNEGSGDHSSTVGLPVEVAHPSQGGVERTTTQAGSVHAFDSASLYAKVSGFLKIQNVDIGDRVKKGDLLAVIDDPEVDKAVDQNQAALDQTRAQVRVAESKVRSARAAKEAAEAQVKVASTMINAKESNVSLQGKMLRRVMGLVADKAADQKLADEQQDRFDVAKSELGVAQAEVLSARAVVMSKDALIEEAEADLLEARAIVEVAQANLGKARVMQEYTRVTSPYDGVITLRSFHPGDFIRSASEGGNLPLLGVAATDKMRVVLPIPDVDVPFVNKGDKAVLQMVALPGKTFTGTISRFSETEDPESRNMRTEVDLPNPDDLLREGMYGRVTVILQPASRDSVTIPSTALIAQSGTGKGTVYVVKDGKAHKVDVHVGNDNGVETEVLSGLTSNDEVITSYNGPISEGTPVKAVLKKDAQPGH